MIYHSMNDDPFFNLACEDLLLRRSNEPETVLFIFRNRPSIIVGRNQNPWQECALPQLVTAGIPIVRRCSGGGTVYHDHGNANFTLIGPRKQYQPKRHLKIAVETLRLLGIETEMTERGGIVCNGRKISGSAFSLTGKRALQHGTMLISSNLSQLGKALSPHLNGNLITNSRAVESVREEVMNLAELTPEITVDKFNHVLMAEFNRLYRVGKRVIRFDADQGPVLFPELPEYLAKYKSRRWLIDRIPPFQIRWQTTHDSNIQIEWRAESKQGCLHRITATSGAAPLPDWAEQVADRLAGVEFWPDLLQESLTTMTAGHASENSARQIADFTRQLLDPT